MAHDIKIEEPSPPEQAPKKGFCDIEKLDKSKIKSVLQNAEEPELGKRVKQVDDNLEQKMRRLSIEGEEPQQGAAQIGNAR